MKKIGILGGTFNPVHSGHLIIANEVLSSFELDKILFIPNKIPPHKKTGKAMCLPEMRLKMLELALKENQKFEISKIELESNEISYTYNTILKLKKTYPEDEFYFISGSDSLISDSWFKLDELLDMLSKFIIVLRPGFLKETLDKKIKELNLKNSMKLKIISIPTLDISSNKLRDRIKEGKTIKYLVPWEVEKFIIKNKLYKGV